MTREKAINILIAVAVCSTEFLNCEGHCPFYHPEVEACEEWTDEQAKEAVDTIAALRTHQEREHPQPLSLDELREMKDEPVYLSVADKLLDGGSGWHIIKAVTSDKIIYRGWQCTYTPIDGLGVDYNLYRHKPEEEPK